MLSLRNYQHDLIAHSHDHPQLVFGLSGQLEFEIAGRGSRIGERGWQSSLQPCITPVPV